MVLGLTWDTALASSVSSRPRPLIWEWAPILSIFVISLISGVVLTPAMATRCKSTPFRSHSLVRDTPLLLAAARAPASLLRRSSLKLKVRLTREEDEPHISKNFSELLQLRQPSL